MTKLLIASLFLVLTAFVGVSFSSTATADEGSFVRVADEKKVADPKKSVESSDEDSKDEEVVEDDGGDMDSDMPEEEATE